MSLHSAAGTGNVEEVRRLLAGTVAVNERDEDGDTPLIMATREGHLEIIALLLDRGADPNLANHAGKTPLSEAQKFQWYLGDRGPKVLELLRKPRAAPAPQAPRRFAVVCRRDTAADASIIQIPQLAARFDSLDEAAKAVEAFCRSKGLALKEDPAVVGKGDQVYADGSGGLHAIVKGWHCAPSERIHVCEVGTKPAGGFWLTDRGTLPPAPDPEVAGQKLRKTCANEACKKPLWGTPELVGKWFKCPHCGTVQMFPGTPAGPETAAPTSPPAGKESRPMPEPAKQSWWSRLLSWLKPAPQPATAAPAKPAPKPAPAAKAPEPPPRREKPAAAAGGEDAVRKCPRCGSVFGDEGQKMINSLLKLRQAGATVDVKANCDRCKASLSLDEMAVVATDERGNRTRCPHCRAPLDDLTRQAINALERFGVGVSGLKCSRCGKSIGTNDYK